MVFLHRVEVQGRDLVVSQGEELSSPVFAYSALPSGLVFDMAEVGAEPALHGVALQGTPEERGRYHILLLDVDFRNDDDGAEAGILLRRSRRRRDQNQRAVVRV